MDCIFCKIAAGQIPSAKMYEDEKMIIIKDISPQSKIHYLLIPKEHYPNIKEMSASQAAVLGECLKKLGELADGFGLQNGFRLVSNCGEHACQSVAHLHIHILGGEQLSPKMS
ncbi:MAG: histidine triad nucleotide-binding protein [Christensenellales bacterium]|jgi:histidine triad (HIT) family protein